MEFSPEGQRNHDACLRIIERMTPDELTPGKPKRYAAFDETFAADSSTYGRFERKPTAQAPQAADSVFERDNEAASKLREWTE